MSRALRRSWLAPGLRAGGAINSYFVFQTLRDQGVIPAGVRFQVSLPLVNSVVRPVNVSKRPAISIG